MEVMKVMPGLSAYPGLTLKASINSIICFGYQIFGEEKVRCLNAWDYSSWTKDLNDDEKLLKDAREILSTADVVVTHNGKRFDWKFFQTRLLKYGMDPLPKINHIDTCALAKQHLFLFNNRLNTLGEFLVKEKKLENGGWDLWVRVMNRDEKAMKLMTEYCKQDVNLLKKVFKKLRPFVNNMPNYNIDREGEDLLCPNCGSTRMKKDGLRYTATQRVQRYSCRDCLTGFSARRKDGLPKS